jgi:hypothetical protein
MPTVTNYLKARLTDAATAAQTWSTIAVLLLEGRQAHDFWQNHRRLEQQGRRAEFWTRFRLSFPRIYACLGSLTDGHCDEALLEFLEFGQPDKMELFTAGKHVCLKAADLWCGADWDLLAAFVKSHFQAEGVAWIGDDPGIDFFDVLAP